MTVNYERTRQAVDRLFYIPEDEPNFRSGGYNAYLGCKGMEGCTCEGKPNTIVIKPDEPEVESDVQVTFYREAS